MRDVSSSCAAARNLCLIIEPHVGATSASGLDAVVQASDSAGDGDHYSAMISINGKTTLAADILDFAVQNGATTSDIATLQT